MGVFVFLGLFSENEQLVTQYGAFSKKEINMRKKDKVYLTSEGLQKLKDELKNLTEVRRVEVAKRIKTARDMGDTSENAEYVAAREEQAFIEGRISELQDIMKHAEISKANTNGVVGVGAKVTVHIDGDEEMFYIVGAPEANPMENKISHESPLGSALLGKKVGDKIEVEAPVGTLTYTILKVTH